MERVGAIIVVVLAAIVASCSASASGGGPQGLHVTLQQSTSFEIRRALQLGFRSEGDTDLRIGEVQLASPLFEPVPPERHDVVVRAGGAGVIMALPFGEARCDEVADGPAQLVTDVDGEEVRLTIDESPSDLLAGLHAAQCHAAAVLEDVDVHLGDHWERPAPTVAEGELELVQRRPGVTAAVEEMEGNVIFTVRTDDRPGPWVEVNDDEPSATVDVVIHAARCDPHAIIEYKRKYVLPVRVRVGGEEPVRLDIETEGTARRTLEELLAECFE